MFQNDKFRKLSECVIHIVFIANKTKDKYEQTNTAKHEEKLEKYSIGISFSIKPKTSY